MKNNKRLLFSIASLGIVVSLIAIPAIAASCSTDKKNDKKENDKTTTNKEVIFSAPQGKYWPLMVAIAPIIKHYNETYKNEPGFLPVVLRTQEDVKTYSETTLVNDTIKSIKEADKQVSNILLGNQTGAFILKSNDRLLDLPSSEFTVQFNDKIKKVHGTLVGEDPQDTNKVYSIPFDLSDTDALQLNLDIMYKLFEIIIKEGGKVSGSIYEASKEANTKGNSIPKRSPFYAIKAKATNELSKLVVTDETFKDFKSVKEFVNTIYENTEFDQAKLTDVTKSARLLSIDYQADVFKKELVSKTTQDDKIWTIQKQADVNQKSVIDYANLLNKDSEQAKNFVSLWDEYRQFIKHKEIKPAPTTESKPINFQSIQFKENGLTDWAGFDILRYESAIGFGASVSVSRATQSPDSIAYLLGGVKDEAAKKAEYDIWTTKHDIKYSPSIDKYSKGSKQVYWEGGSSLLAVKSDDEELNKATIKFLNFLFTGQTKKQDGTLIDNSVYIAEKSGYIVPTQANLTKETLKKLQDYQKELQTKYDARIAQLEEKNRENFLIKDEIRDDLASSINNLNSAILSLESLLKFALGEAYDTNYPEDTQSVLISSTLSKELLNISKLNNENKPESTDSGEVVLKKLQELAKK